jgi:hypothetical protein
MYATFIEPLSAWKFWLDMASAVCAFGAALFWLRASLVKGPGEVRHAFHLPLEGSWEGDVPDAVTAMAKQSRLNAWAAGFAAVAAMLTALSVLIGTRWE